MDKQNKQNNLAIILTLSLGTLLGTMNLSIFNVAMPALMTYFNTDVATVQWLSSGYMLAAGVITPAAAFWRSLLVTNVPSTPLFLLHSS